MKKPLSLLYLIVIVLFILTACDSKSMPTDTALPPHTPQPTETSQPTETPQPTETIALTPTPSIGSTMTGEDSAILVYVPEGEFTMGNDSYSGERPIHQVYLDAFWIDQTEVTNRQYGLCIAAQKCEPPVWGYLDGAEYSNHPVTYVNWNMAKAYCEWAGRRLPTEAEWEKAARGTDGNTYPWGNGSTSPSLLNFGITVGSDTEVGKYPDGKSIYGAYDMAGNVWEWVNDWYSKNYYQTSPSANPAGPDSGTARVIRGGSWLTDSLGVRSSYRYSSDPTDSMIDLGFRCARSLP